MRNLTHCISFSDDDEEIIKFIKEQMFMIEESKNLLNPPKNKEVSGGMPFYKNGTLDIVIIRYFSMPNDSGYAMFWFKNIIVNNQLNFKIVFPGDDESAIGLCVKMCKSINDIFKTLNLPGTMSMAVGPKIIGFIHT